MDGHVAEAFRRRTREACAAGLRAAGIAFGFVNDVAAFARHPALRRITLDTPAGRVSLAAPAPRFSDGERALGPVPGLGVDTDRVLAEFAGRKARALPWTPFLK